MSPPFVFEELVTPTRTVRFESIERPHGDALTFLLVTIEAHGLSATTSIETRDGDGGFDLDSERPTASGSTSDLSHLSGFLESLATGPVWEGKRRWGSLGNELVVSAGVDLLGHVTMEFTVAPQPWRPSWSATCSVSSTLGDLRSKSSDLRQWVAEQT